MQNDPRQAGAAALVPSSPEEGEYAPGNALEHWLNVQCGMISGLQRALLLRISPDRKNALLEASWPELLVAGDNLIAKSLFASLKNETQLEEYPGEDDRDTSIRLYHPIEVSKQEGVRFVAVLEMDGREPAERAAVVKLLGWNSEWLRYTLTSATPEQERTLSSVFSMTLACLEREDFQSAATVLVSTLVEQFSCQRVSLGLCRGRHVEVQVLSHSARFKQEANLVQAISAAMDEAVDQDVLVVYPDRDAESGRITLAHAELSRQARMGTIVTLPLSEAGEVVGALTLERSVSLPLTDGEIHAIEQLGALLAPVLALRHREERSLAVKAGHSLALQARRLFGPEHIRMKLVAACAALLLAFFSVAQGDWRVTADAVVEGSVQRTVSAPIDGYIATVESRAGDVVEAGQRMGSLDDGDLRLQHLKWSTLRQQMVSELREAMAQHDRTQVNIINAKIEQADAELKLIDEQLSRTVLLAPYAGIVIEGDLSQLLGTPVSRGDPLFKVAPLEDYRIILNVSEADVMPVAAGQSGRLVLAAMPDKPLAFEVAKVTPVSTAEGGRNYFRVEAALTETDTLLQPGMEGVGKIEVGEANLFWLWTRDLLNWLRLQAWTLWR
ncbi:MAG: HlyD family efflux transporter periplasmic adaptor subunit [Halioglobus sp.]|nr:HlyD family efflux transporter periplasmic adaptor subunit [Halioglobus sp.]